MTERPGNVRLSVVVIAAGLDIRRNLRGRTTHDDDEGEPAVD
ncbi:hypothetical protein [Nesterenkonia marinintestina]|nr:hypothetical protein [Nesterenkonia sp. GX14115]